MTQTQQQTDQNTKNKETPKVGFFGKLLAGLVLLGFVLLLIVALTNIHHEGMVGYIFQWIFAFYFLAFGIGIIFYLIKEWKTKAWYMKLLYLLGVIITLFMSGGYFYTSFLDISYVNQPVNTRLTSLDLDVHRTAKSSDYYIEGQDSSGVTRRFKVNRQHFNEALDSQNAGTLHAIEVSYLPNTQIVMKFSLE